MINFIKFKRLKSNMGIIFIISIFLIFCNSIFAGNNSLYNLLGHYGISNKTQKKAFENLLHLGQIVPYNQSLEQFYPERDDNSTLLNDILILIKQLQRKFTLRSGKQERWDVNAPQWMEKNKKKIIDASRELGFIDAIYPTVENVDAICILGGTYKTMRLRMEYANNLINNNKLNAKYLVLLAGERYVKIGVDGSNNELLEIATKYQIEDLSKLTETHLIKFIYENSPLYNKMEVIVIDTPARDLPRPTTQTTLVELIETLKNYSNIKMISFISNQPVIKYQAAVIDQVNDNNLKPFQYEVIGPEIAPTEVTPTNLLEGLGSYMWAKTPKLIRELNDAIDNEAIINKFKELYSDQFLIFFNIQNLFNKKTIQ